MIGLQILGHARVIEDAEASLRRLMPEGYKAPRERVIPTMAVL